MSTVCFYEVFCVVYKQYAVKVIDLMLEDLREKTAPTALKGRAVFSLCAHGCSFEPSRLAVYMPYRKTPLIHL
jgi:hypothetical protein